MKRDATKTSRKSRGERMAEEMRQLARDLRRGADSTKYNRRTLKFDLTPTTYDAARVKKVRELLAASQAVFAQFLGVSLSTVIAWEHNVNTPSSVAARFMDEICHNPAYWQKRLADSVITVNH